jgi:hypothetical protein
MKKKKNFTAYFMVCGRHLKRKCGGYASLMVPNLHPTLYLIQSYLLFIECEGE